MKEKFFLISAVPFLLASCATSDLPELPSVIAQPQSTTPGALSELPQLPDTSQITTPVRAAELPRIPALPPVSELPLVAERPLATQPASVNSNTSITENPQVEILAETTEQTVIATPAASVTGQTRQSELKTDVATATQTPTQTNRDDTRINIEFIYDEPAVESSSNIPLASIANDLVSVLAYIPSLNPTQSSIRISTPGSEFDNLVKASMQSLGYSFNKGSSRDRRQHLTTSFSETRRDQQRSELTAIIAIDGTLIKRIYFMQDNSFSPATLYTVHGIDEQLVLPSDQITVL